MKITEVRIKLMNQNSQQDGDGRLLAFCSITFDDCFVVRDLKIIKRDSGPLVSMPSRKLTAHCPHCPSKNHVRARYCNQCGKRLDENQVAKDQDGRLKLYADIAHPITPACRDMIQERVIAEYRAEQERAKQPGYVSRYDAIGHEDYDNRSIASQAPSDQNPPPSCARKYPHNDQFGEGIL